MQRHVLILILAAVGYLIYFFSPIDLIPDFTGLFGRLDELVLLAYLVWLVRKEWRLAKQEKPPSPPPPPPMIEGPR